MDPQNLNQITPNRRLNRVLVVLQKRALKPSWIHLNYIPFWWFGELFSLLQETLQRNLVWGMKYCNVMIWCCSSLESTTISVITTVFLSVLCGINYCFSLTAFFRIEHVITSSPMVFLFSSLSLSLFWAFSPVFGGRFLAYSCDLAGLVQSLNLNRRIPKYENYKIPHSSWHPKIRRKYP